MNMLARVICFGGLPVDATDSFGSRWLNTARGKDWKW
jgi:hypothetical protein